MATALLVVDVQRDFCEGGSLPVAGGAAVAGRVGAVALSYPVVVATRDWHVDPAGHFAGDGTPPDYATTWPVHCLAGTPGAAWHPDLRLPPGTVVVSKGEHAAAYSGFEGTDPGGVPLAGVLRDRGVDAVDIVGVATSYCVRATALDAAREGFATRVLAGLTADVDPAATPVTLAALRAAGVEIVG